MKEVSTKEVKGHLAQDKDEAELSKLMRLAQGGDSQSYRQALLKMREMLSKYIRNSFRRFRIPAEDSAEDVLQEVLLAIHQKRETYNPEQFFLPWMYAIARYKVIDFLRRSKVALRSTVSLDDELENLENLMVFESDSSLDADKLIDLLPEKQKKILLLVKIEGLSMEEASAKTGYSVSDVKVTVHRAIKSLQEKVQEKVQELEKEVPREDR
ncbi:sigma-70 family RNA polymerase sigma factor [Bdellovibrio svalbardensis]|uniref:Sigma-70 family RNA polymerase sigma factor n=1 Tax=Bdellovibrio svalbardensis TaxID=2972972 RepID=A0ABT6DGL5_9BACT|nr:sigma-70 family RNA polymerase sigma factor [Bdellovibrio svalbardensis]MDG0815996.1 sigma-70 family RNA polymerase sigma factor [Bdellovibrio svalbardensis]